MSIAALLSVLGDDATLTKPDLHLEKAVTAIIETCAVQLELELEPSGDPAEVRDCRYAYGSAISLASAPGSLLLMIMCDPPSARHLTRLLFAMDPDDDVPVDDMADALNEVVNMAGGVLKTHIADTNNEFTLGLPLFFEGLTSLRHIQQDIKGMGQRLEFDSGLSMNVNVIWKDGS